MAFFYLLLFLLLIFGTVGVVIYFFTDLANRMKYTILAALLLGWILVTGYSYYQNKKRLYHERLLFEYNLGNTLDCRDPFGEIVKVNKKEFDFVNGTLVFVGKEGTNVEGLVVPLERCRASKK